MKAKRCHNNSKDADNISKVNSVDEKRGYDNTDTETREFKNRQNVSRSQNLQKEVESDIAEATMYSE